MLWWDSEPPQRQELQALAAHGLDPVSEAFLGIAEPDEVQVWTQLGADLWARCNAETEAPAGWLALREALRASEEALRSTPWTRGWSAARAFRSAMKWNEAEAPPDLEPAIGFSLDAARVEDRLRGSDDSLVAWGPGRRPVRARGVARRSEARERFLFARDLYPLLFEAEPARAHARYLSSGDAGTNPIANAFAAEVIAPVEAVREALGKQVWLDDDQLAALARRLRAPTGCVRHQIRNHRLARVDWNMKNALERRRRLAAVIAWFLALAGCGSGAGPADVAPDESDTAVERLSKVDLLWVIDDSTSMCEEQNALVRAAPSFFSRLILVLGEPGPG